MFPSLPIGCGCMIIDQLRILRPKKDLGSGPEIEVSYLATGDGVDELLAVSQSQNLPAAHTKLIP